MQKVAWFDDVISFSLAWANLHHHNIENLFFNERSSTVNVHMIDSEEKRINGLSLFEYSIDPKWDDPINE